MYLRQGVHWIQPVVPPPLLYGRPDLILFLHREANGIGDRVEVGQGADEGVPV
jgi:hypothetical protein